MKTVYSAPHIALVSLMKNVLEGQGIECWIRNEFLAGAAGQLPPIECWPELCVGDDVAAEAEAIVENALSCDPEPLKSWKCPSCGEDVEGQFTECWKCGKSRPR